MRKLVLLVLALFAVIAVATHASAQTTTNYTLPTGTICGTQGPEHCTYYPTEGGRFVTGDPWTQYVYADNANVDYCFDFTAYQSTSAWAVTDTPNLGSTAKLFTLDCATQSNAVNSVRSEGTLHAEIHAFSYLASYRSCSRSGCVTRFRTEWAVLDNSFLSITKPSTVADGSDPMPVCRHNKMCLPTVVN